MRIIKISKHALNFLTYPERYEIIHFYLSFNIIDCRRFLFYIIGILYRSNDVSQFSKYLHTQIYMCVYIYHYIFAFFMYICKCTYASVFCVHILCTRFSNEKDLSVKYEAFAFRILHKYCNE